MMGGRSCHPLESISSGAQYVILRKYFSRPLRHVLVCNPTNKLGQQIGRGLLIANHLDQSLWWGNQKHWSAVRSYLLHSFLEVHSAAAPFTSSHGNHRNYVEPKPFSWPKAAYFGLSSSNLTVQDHIPSTAGDALSRHKELYSTIKQPMTKGRDVVGAHNAHNVEKSHVS
jgi:hypothetical protein